MNKKLTKIILRFLFLIFITLSSGCGQSDINDSSTLTLTPFSTPTTTLTPSQTNTLDPIHLEGTLIYSDYESVYVVDFQNQIAKMNLNFAGHILTAYNNVYVIKDLNNNSGFSEIIKTNINGTNPEQILPPTNKYQPLECLKVSPDRKYLLCYYGKGLRSLLIIDTETKIIQTISPKSNHFFQSIFWSPDSKKIYLLDAVNVSSLNGIPRAGVYEQGRLLEFSLETNKLSEVLPQLPNPNFRWSVPNPIIGWSPDGTSLLINLTDKSGDLNENFERPYLYIFNVNSRNLKQIEVDGNVTNFEWSTDGTKIALQMYIENQRSDLFIYYTLDEILRKYDINAQTVDSFSWSPDSKKLIVSTKDMLTIKNNHTYLHLFDDKSSKIELIADIGYLQNPHNFSWSPNSDKVLYEQSEPSLSNTVYLYLLDINKKKVTNLYTIAKGIERHGRIIEYWWYYRPTWSPDGKNFAFITMTSDPRDFEQNFILNIQSAYDERSLQIQIPRKGFIGISWVDTIE